MLVINLTDLFVISRFECLDFNVSNIFSILNSCYKLISYSKIAQLITSTTQKLIMFSFCPQQSQFIVYPDDAYTIAQNSSFQTPNNCISFIKPKWATLKIKKKTEKRVYYIFVNNLLILSRRLVIENDTFYIIIVC